MNALAMRVLRGDHGPAPIHHSRDLQARSRRSRRRSRHSVTHPPHPRAQDLLRSLLAPSPAQRPTVAEILSAPLLRKHIAAYAITVLGSASEVPTRRIPPPHALPRGRHSPASPSGGESSHPLATCTGRRRRTRRRPSTRSARSSHRRGSTHSSRTSRRPRPPASTEGVAAAASAASRLTGPSRVGAAADASGRLGRARRRPTAGTTWPRRTMASSRCAMRWVDWPGRCVCADVD